MSFRSINLSSGTNIKPYSKLATLSPSADGRRLPDGRLGGTAMTRGDMDKTKRRLSQSSSTSSKRACTSTVKAPEIFPYFSSGQVSVQLHPTDTTYHYRFHRAVLERNSGWFEQQMEEIIAEDNQVVMKRGTGEVVRFKFVLEKSEDGAGEEHNGKEGADMEGWRLVRKPLHPKTSMFVDLCDDDDEDDANTPAPEDETPVSSAVAANSPVAATHTDTANTNMRSATSTTPPPTQPTTLTPPTSTQPTPSKPKAKPTIKTEPSHHIPLPSSSPPPHLLDAYTTLLSTYYNHPPILPPTLSASLAPTALLLSLSTTLQSLPTIRPHLTSHLLSFHTALYTSIATDPPRYLLLSLPLHSRPLFTESLIHLTGCYPSCPWPTPSSALPPSILTLIARKARALEKQREHIDRDLLLNTIKLGDRAVALTETGKRKRGADTRRWGRREVLETWLVVQIFRDWVAAQINAGRAAGESWRGAWYRAMGRGGDGYLKEEEVRARMEWYVDGGEDGKGKRGGEGRGRMGAEWGSGVLGGPERWAAVGEDLGLLKEYARGVVRELCWNGLVGGLEKGGGEGEVEYLTCVEVAEGELPWMGGEELVDGQGGVEE